MRSESLKPKPFVRLDPTTLEEDEKEEFELEADKNNLEWKENEETGRSLTFTPLFTDGHYLYVISQRKAPKAAKGKYCVHINQSLDAAEDKKEDQDKPPMFVVEVYDPSTKAFAFVREVALYKNEDFEPFIKNSNSVDFLKDSSFATNGQVLVI